MKIKLRFSIRTLAIVVTLICAYFGAWEATKRSNPIRDYKGATTGVPAPFILWEDWYDDIGHGQYVAGFFNKQSPITKNGTRRITRYYYLWLLGPKIRLPFKSERIE